MAAVGSSLTVIHIENTYFDRRGAQLHPQEDAFFMGQLQSAPAAGIDIATAFRDSCTTLATECAEDIPGSTFVTGLVVDNFLHVGHLGDSSLCLVNLQADGKVGAQLLTPWHSGKVYLNPEDHLLGHIKVNRTLGDKPFRDKPGFNPAFEFSEPINLATHGNDFICMFSDGLIDFLNAFLDHVFAKQRKAPPTIDCPAKKLAYVLSIFKHKFPEKSLPELFQELSRNIALWEKSPDHDDITCIAMPIVEGTLISLADGHGEESGDLTAKKAVTRFPALLSAQLSVTINSGTPTPVSAIVSKEGAAGDLHVDTGASGGGSSSPLATAAPPPLASPTPMAVAAGAVATSLDLSRVTTILRSILEDQYPTVLDTTSDLNAMQKALCEKISTPPSPSFTTALLILMRLQEKPTAITLAAIEGEIKVAMQLETLSKTLGF